MKLAKILSVLRDDPLLCSDTYRATLLELFMQHAELSGADFRAERTGLAKSGSLLEVEQAEVRDNVCIIPIGGPIGQDLGEFEKGAGAVDADDIKAELQAAEDNDEVENIILNIDSPGGTVTGTPELADYIMACDKPVYAFTRGQMCSAGYWLAAACDGIFATKSAIIGNIGVALVVKDLSKMADMAGVKVKVFASSPIKGAGVAGTQLSASQEIFIQAHVMKLAENFYSHVRSQRASISDADMQGQFYSGQEAMDRGFVDGLMADIDELIAFLS